MSLPFEDLETVEDFLGNDAFRFWVTERRPEDQAYWQAWLALHPDRKDIYEEAVATFLVLQGKTVAISEQQVKGKTEKILDQLTHPDGIIKPLFRTQWARWGSVAAVISLIVWWQLGQSPFQTVSFTKTPKTPVARDVSWKVVKNETGQSMVVFLPDNSSVLLSSGSQLRFRKQLTDAVREVFLEGEGFFEVTKNPARPFIVYAPNLTTKVLGTSFLIRSFGKETTAFVKVKTGKVTVLPVKSPGKSVLLTVNEELRLSETARPLVTRENFSTKENPSAPLAQPFAFNYTPVTEILDLLEASYHMPIQYDRNLLKNCTFTGQLNDVPFLEKVRLICLTTASTFELVDNQVVIHSQGCN